MNGGRALFPSGLGSPEADSSPESGAFRPRHVSHPFYKVSREPRSSLHSGSEEVRVLSDHDLNDQGATSAVDGEWIRGLPKAEVHVHLEGCFDADQIVQLAAAAGEPLPRPRPRLFELPDLPALLEFLDWVCGLVRTHEQVEQAAYRFAEREARSGVRYADLIFNPTHWPWRDRLGEFIEALDAGFSAAERDGLPSVGLCVSLLRQQSASEAGELVDWLVERKHPRVVALSIDGNEAAAGRTGPRFADAFVQAAAGGLRRTVHAGESSGPEGVWDAVELLGAERIDHGIKAVEDPELVQRLADWGIPLGVCPGSNVALGLYPDLRSHPIEALRAAGVPVSVNTDDPASLETDLVSEYLATAKAFDWTEAIVRDVARTSIEASFADEDLKRELRAELDRSR
jgi:adenosine deaminase